jgi:uncharacterized membrane protein YdbT with pleckstrin-like domain
MTIEKNLVGDETVKLQAKKHWFAPIQASFAAILMILGAGLLRLISPNSDGFFGWVGNIVDFISLVLVLGGIGWILYNVIEWRTATFAVTNLRVMREEGLLKHRSSATMLSSLSDVKTNQSFIGKQLAFGDIVIYSQSGDAGVDRFRTITGPMEFRNAIVTEKAGQPAPTATPTILPDPAATTAAAPAAPAGTSATPANPEMTSADAATALASLADLRDRGAITAQEFETKKAELLARM